MQHFSCDLCSKTLSPDGGLRYAVRIDGRAVEEEMPVPCYAESDADAVDAVDDMLLEREELYDSDAQAVELPPLHATKEYDLCGSCYAKYLADPLGRESRSRPQFSRN